MSIDQSHRLVRLGRGVCGGVLLVFACSSEDEATLTHGTIPVSLRRLASEPESPYPGTDTIRLSMVYSECLTSYYQTNPQFRVEGLNGSQVFGGYDDGGEGWRDRLCEETGGFVSCEVTGFMQLLDIQPQLRVTYQVDGDVEYRRLHFGPLPTEAAAGCVPRIEGVSGSGFDANGNEIWSGVLVGIGETGQGGDLVLEVARTE